MIDYLTAQNFVLRSGLFGTAAGVMADMICSMAGAGGDSAELYLAMALSVQYLQEKNTCVRLDLLGGTTLQNADGSESLTLPDYENWRCELQQQKYRQVIAVLEDDRPWLKNTLLVLDKHGGCYLQRQWSFEQSIIHALRQRGSQICDLPSFEKGFLADLVSFFSDKTSHPAPDYQQLAVLAALRHKLLVLSGGPGTGKTTVAAAVLAVKLMQNANLRLILTAPTAKAAARLQESLQGNLEHLNVSDQIKERISAAECATVHRTLGVLWGSHEFKRNRQNPLVCDLLLVDESSMVSLDLMARLLEALPENADLILLGDRYQLASVEAGSVLADICDGAEANVVDKDLAADFFRLTDWQVPSFDTGSMQNPLAGCIVELQENHRFSEKSKLLGEAAALIRNMQSCDAAETAEKLFSMKGEEYNFLPVLDGTIESVLQRKLSEKRLDSGESMLDLPALAAAADAESRRSAFKLLAAFKILAPGYEGICGIRNLNRTVMDILHLSNEESIGLPVLIKRNDYRVKLFNGDMGLIALDENGEKRVFFADPDGSERVFRLKDLPEYEPVFAMSVHKSQGSGFGEVLFILPEKAQSLMSREMIYTAMTRAEKKLTCIGSQEILAAALAQPTERMSTLACRLTAPAADDN